MDTVRCDEGRADTTMVIRDQPTQLHNVCKEQRKLRKPDLDPDKCSYARLRARSSAKQAVQEIATGLPFQNGNASIRLKRHSPPGNRATNDAMTASAESQNLTIERKHDACAWLDIAMGKPTSIDPRTGMVVVEVPTRDDGLCRASVKDRVPRIVSGDLRRSMLLSHSAHPPCNAQSYHDSDDKNYKAQITTLAYFDEDGKVSSAQACRKPSALQLDRQCNKLSHDVAVQYCGDGGHLSRHELFDCDVISQIDKKFILFTCGENTNLKMVLADQHAIDERCKLEALIQSVHKPTIKRLSQPLVYQIALREARLLQFMQVRFRQLGIEYNCSLGNEDPVTSVGDSNRTTLLQVTHLPIVIAERCCNAPDLIIDLLRDELWTKVEARKWTHKTETMALGQDKALQNANVLSVLYEFPAKLLDLLNSRACRSAIMFNDELQRVQCIKMIEQLSTCMLPFQCAHGRPSMTVLAELGQLPHYDAFRISRARDVHTPEHLGRVGPRMTRGRDEPVHYAMSSGTRDSILNTCDWAQAPSFAEKYRAWGCAIQA